MRLHIFHWQYRFYLDPLHARFPSTAVNSYHTAPLQLNVRLLPMHHAAYVVSDGVTP